MRFKPLSADVSAALSRARAAFEVGDVESERNALRSIPLASLSDAQLVRLVKLHAEANAERELEEAARSALSRRFQSERDLLRLAVALASVRHADLAWRLSEGAIGRASASPQLVVHWASLLVDRLDRPADVIAALGRPVSGSWPPWLRALVRGKAQSAMDEPEQALASLTEAAEAAPHEPAVWFELAALQRRIGLVEESRSSFRRTVDLDPDNVTARRMLGYEHRYRLEDDLLAGLEGLQARSADFPPSTRVELHYALAKAYEDTERTDEAFAHYQAAGRIQKQISPWEPVRQAHLDARLMEQATTRWIVEQAERGDRSERPVFIVGMPRSGTTLVEQMIASHPDAFGAGELGTMERLLHGVRVGSFTLLTRPAEGPEARSAARELSLNARAEGYLAELHRRSPSAKRVLDKMPGNYRWVGLIAAMLPGARFIHCRRHPLDTCLSQYRLYFGSEVPYSYDLRDLGKAYRGYDSIIRHWSTIVPPERFHEIRYEDLVHDFERRSRELIAFCGLPWDGACLDYAHSRRQVRTASATQVRSVPHTRAIGRWQQYRTHLAPLIEELGELVDDYDRGRCLESGT